jgi:DNA-binding transcriptional ArsR family regulator
MRDEILSRALRISDSRVAAAFADPLRRRLVLHLARRECSIGELAAATGVDLKRLHYYVTALVELGLVVVARERRRPGRPIKLYRAIADAFFVPEEATMGRPEDALARELRDSLARLRDPSREGVIYHLSDAGEPRIRRVRAAETRPIPAAENWRIVRLSRPDALQMAKDIENHLKALVDNPDNGSETYLVHFAFAPSLNPMPRAADKGPAAPGSAE